MTRRFGTGLVIGKFYPPHAGHHRLIDAAVRDCERVTVVVAPSSRESVPLDLRVAWLRAAHPDATVVGVLDDHPVDYADPAAWDAHCAVFAAAAGRSRFDAVFSGEKYGDELARRFGGVHASLDRAQLDVSGTAVRADPVAHWDLLGPGVRGWLARRVVVLGAESTGTTTTARALARLYRLRGGVWARTAWVPEYGRELSERKLAALGPGAQMADVSWGRTDFAEVAAEQNAAEDRAAATGAPILICDTDVLATTVWEERYLGSATVVADRRPDLYLLTSDDGVPFTDDGLRDGEHLRPWMTGRFREVLAAQPVPWLELTGPYRQRLRTALAACDDLLGRGWEFAEPLPVAG